MMLGAAKGLRATTSWARAEVADATSYTTLVVLVVFIRIVMASTHLRHRITEFRLRVRQLAHYVE